MSETLGRLADPLVALAVTALFLVALRVFDTFRLVSTGRLGSALLVGYGVGVISLVLDERMTGGSTLLALWVFPVVIEVLKAVFPAYLVRNHRVGFLVDAAILGFATGLGTATVAILRGGPDGLAAGFSEGLGLALAHGASTAVYAVVAKGLWDRRRGGVAFLPGLIPAAIIALAWVHVPLPLFLKALAVGGGSLALLAVALRRSAASLREWLGKRFDVELELHEMIHEGVHPESRLGVYFDDVRGQFPPLIAADMLCYLQVHVELALKAKGMLLMQQQGVPRDPDPETGSLLAELTELETRIGHAGVSALSPLIHVSTRDLWQLHMLEER